MKSKTIVLIVVCALMLCCCVTHRRVIRALIKHEPMPKAPKWHFWVKKEKRRDAGTDIVRQAVEIELNR